MPGVPIQSPTPLVASSMTLCNDKKKKSAYFGTLKLKCNYRLVSNYYIYLLWKYNFEIILSLQKSCKTSDLYPACCSGACYIMCLFFKLRKHTFAQHHQQNCFLLELKIKYFSPRIFPAVNSAHRRMSTLAAAETLGWANTNGGPL